METAHLASQTVAVSLSAGVFAQCLARHLRVPGIVLLLAAGALLGPEGAGWVVPASLGDFLYWIVDFAVAVVLFEGGLNLQLSRLRREEVVIRRLVTIGALVTLGLATVCVWFLLGWSWELSALFGSLVVVTGPTVVAPLLRELRLRPNIKTVLEAEGVLIDPIGAILAVMVLQVALVPHAQTLTSELLEVGMRLGFGLVAGVAAGFLLGGALRLRHAVPHGLENIFALASVILLFYGCDLVLGHSGIMAVTVAGVVVGNVSTRVDRDLREFKDQMTLMLVGLLFVLLAADIRVRDIVALGWPGAAVVGALVLVVRPVDVFVSAAGSGLRFKDKAFIAWIAPRGIVAAAVTSLTASTMEAQGMSGSAELRALVFLTIASTVVLAGFTARPLSYLLRLRLPKRDRVAILGAQGLGLALARELRDAGIGVVFMDSDPMRCRKAQDESFTVVFGDALEERTLQRAQIDLVETVIGLTPNDHLNTLFVSNARDLFGVPRAYVALSSLSSEGGPERMKRIGAEVLFDGPRDVGRWDTRARHDDVVVEYLEFRKPQKGALESDSLTPAARDRRWVILAVKRDRTMRPMTARFEPEEGDVAAVAIYEPERDAALEALDLLGWGPIGAELELAAKAD